MAKVKAAGIGFHHPDRNIRPLTKRKLAFAHLLMTAALVICIVIAVTAVAIGSARAETIGALAAGREGALPLTIPMTLLMGGVGGIAVALTRKA